MDTNNNDIDKNLHDKWFYDNENSSFVKNAETNDSTDIGSDHPHQLESTPLSESPSDQNGLCCSVLTTVIDFTMTAPTQIYEPDEFEQNSRSVPTSDPNSEEHHKPALLLVPVMRIFGPIIRRQKRSQADSSSAMENNYLNRRPYQSACLYVHGAYPYMLARPTAAGLDEIGRAHV